MAKATSQEEVINLRRSAVHELCGLDCCTELEVLDWIDGGICPGLVVKEGFFFTSKNVTCIRESRGEVINLPPSMSSAALSTAPRAR